MDVARSESERLRKLKFLRKTARKITALVLLFAFTASLFFAAFPFVKTEAETDKVYCPLTKKLQPVHPLKRSVQRKSLDGFCATDDRKIQFEQALLETQNLVSYGKISFETLAFDFFQKGKSAFKNLPNHPEFPRQNLAKSQYSIIGAGNFEKQTSLAEIKNPNLDFSQNPRPPTFQTAVKFDFQIAQDLEKISRNINPRSPPANLS